MSDQKWHAWCVMHDKVHVFFIWSRPYLQSLTCSHFLGSFFPAPCKCLCKQMEGRLRHLWKFQFSVYFFFKKFKSTDIPTLPPPPPPPSLLSLPPLPHLPSYPTYPPLTSSPFSSFLSLSLPPTTYKLVFFQWPSIAEGLLIVLFVIVQVVSHEIAHSWTGNLVTNRNWEHFWYVNCCSFNFQQFSFVQNISN